MTSKHFAESLNFLLLQKEKEVLVLTLQEIATFNHDKTNSKTTENLVLMLLKLTRPL